MLSSQRYVLCLCLPKRKLKAVLAIIGQHRTAGSVPKRAIKYIDLQIDISGSCFPGLNGNILTHDKKKLKVLRTGLMGQFERFQQRMKGCDSIWLKCLKGS